MPCVRIATGTWAAGSEMKLIEAVQSALVAAFRIPESDRDVMLDTLAVMLHNGLFGGGRRRRGGATETESAAEAEAVTETAPATA